MAKTRSMTRNENHNNAASRRKRLKTSDNGGTAMWSDLNHDVLFLVMMRLGVVDFIGFSGVCKSWRSFALSNRQRFMASSPPMSMWIHEGSYNYKKCYCYLKDFEGRKFKTLLPISADWTCVGLTCGYLVFYREKTNDLWLLNPITRCQLQFPALPCLAELHLLKVILVFSPSMSGSVLVVSHKLDNSIWFSVARTGLWNHVSSSFPIIDLLAFKGKIYILNSGCCLWELRLNSDPKVTLLEIKNFVKPRFITPKFVSLGENLYVIDELSDDLLPVYELDFGKMEWVLLDEKTTEELAFFFSIGKFIPAIKPELWADHLSQYKRYAYFLEATASSLKGRFFYTSEWYFPHECVNINLIDE